MARSSGIKLFIGLSLFTVIVLILHTHLHQEAQNPASGTAPNAQRTGNNENTALFNAQDSSDVGSPVMPYEQAIQSVRLAPALQQRRIVLVTSYRSGSSFFGEIFRQNPSMHFVYEPLKLLTLDNKTQTQKGPMERIQTNLDTWCERFLSCNYGDLFEQSYSNAPYMTAKLRAHFTRETFGQHLDLNITMDNIKQLNVSTLEETCSRYDHRVMKIIRASNLATLKPMMLSKDIRVILLIRDIRGMMLSRFEILAHKADNTPIKTYLWHPKHKAAFVASAKRECERLLGFIDFIKDLIPFSQALHRKFAVIRYEDIAQEPMALTERTYKFIELPVDAQVRSWILNNTAAPDGLQGDKHFYSTKRNSRANAEKWRRVLSMDLVEKVQQIAACTRVMDFFGYRHATSAVRLWDLSKSLLKDPSAMLKFRIKY